MSDKIQESLNQLNQELVQFQNLIQAYKNSPQSLKQLKQQEVQNYINQLNQTIVTCKLNIKQTASVPPEQKQLLKQLLEKYNLLSKNFTQAQQTFNTVNSFENDLRQRAGKINNQYLSQTDELKDMNQKVEEGIVKLNMNAETIIQQDEQLQGVNEKFTHVTMKSQAAQKMVNQMQRKEKRATLGAIITFGILATIDVALAIVVIVQNV